MPGDTRLARTFQRALLFTLVTPLLTLALGASVLAWRVAGLVDSLRQVDRISNVIGLAWRTQKLVVDMEAELHGYLFRGEPERAVAFHTAQARLEPVHDELHLLMREGSRDDRAFMEAHDTFEAWRSFAEEAITSLGAQSTPRVEAAKRDKQLFQNFDAAMRRFIDQQQALRAQQNEAVIAVIHSTLVWSIGVVLLIASGCALVAFRQLHRLSGSYSTALLEAQRLAAQEQDLLKMEERAAATFKSFIDSLPDGILAHTQGKVMFLNPKLAEFLGRDLGSLIGRQITEFVHPEDTTVIVRRIQAVQEDGVTPPLAVRFVRRDGTVIYLEATGRLVDLHGGKVALVRLHDLTERRQLTAKLVELDRLAAVGTLAAGVGHEINNPLSYVVSNLGAVRDELRRLQPDQPIEAGVLADVREALDDAHGGAERIRSIVRDLRGFARVDDEAVESFDVVEPLRAALGIAAAQLKPCATVVEELAPTPPVLGSAGRLSQVLLNLVINAAHAMAGGDPQTNFLRVRTAVREGRVAIEIEDTGPGMSAETLARIFEPFFTTKPVGQGTGLGLSISVNIVKSMGGELQVRSVVGQGTTFTVLLPRASAHAA